VQPFDTALAFTLPAEGGNVNNSHDDGRETSRGVTQATYDTWRDIQKLPRREVTMMTDAEKVAIYRDNYWTPGKCDRLPLVLAVVHFDWCVNHGVPGALKTLQKALGFTGDDVDGVPGPKTFMAVQACDPAATAKAYNDQRRAWWNNRVQERPDQGVFLKGELARVDRLDAYTAAL